MRERLRHVFLVPDGRKWSDCESWLDVIREVMAAFVLGGTAYLTVVVLFALGA